MINVCVSILYYIVRLLFVDLQMLKSAVASLDFFSGFSSLCNPQVSVTALQSRSLLSGALVLDSTTKFGIRKAN